MLKKVNIFEETVIFFRVLRWTESLKSFRYIKI